MVLTFSISHEVLFYVDSLQRERQLLLPRHPCLLHFLLASLLSSHYSCFSNPFSRLPSFLPRTLTRPFVTLASLPSPVPVSLSCWMESTFQFGRELSRDPTVSPSSLRVIFSNIYVRTLHFHPPNEEGKERGGNQVDGFLFCFFSPIFSREPGEDGGRIV